MKEKPTRQPNHLKGQTSPYLLQHLYNPVDWYPWGEEALQKARAENKPLLVSIGYSACHWCHVMERESFEDPEVARLMNQYFICIKVDREERPDIDHLYINAVQLISGQGGWPLNCFALPDGKPFWGGTYFAKEQWKNILVRIAALYRNNYSYLEEQALRITEGLSLSSFLGLQEDVGAFSSHDAEAMVNNLLNHMDQKEGGTRGAPKFPLPNNYEFLLHYYFHTGHKASLSQVLLTLRKMAMGGIYDQIGGGFSRYSTDIHWKVPHFEKMLYDNAQLVSLYANVYKVVPDPLFKQVVFETIGFVQRELTSPEGLFWSALDADSEGEEGRYYLWTEKEIEEVLSHDAPLIKQYFNCGGKGFWEKGKNILLRDLSDEDFARRHNINLPVLKQKVADAKAKLLLARQKRVRPGLDDKIIVSWNAMMIKGLADAFAAFGTESFLYLARNAARQIILKAMSEKGHLFRNLKGEKPAIDGFLEDYAWLAYALIRLFEVTGEEDYLKQSACLTAYALEEFSAEGTSLFLFSGNKAQPHIVPFYEFHDNVIPSSNSVLARNLLYLSNLFGRSDWGQQSNRMLRDMLRLITRYSSSYTNWGILLLHHVFPFYTMVITGPKAHVFSSEASRKYLPNVLMAWAGEPNSSLPVLKNRYHQEEDLFYVCQAGQCKLPVKTLEEALTQII